MDSKTQIIVHNEENGAYFAPISEDGQLIEDAWDADVLSEIEAIDFVTEVEVVDGHLAIVFDSRIEQGDDSEMVQNTINPLLFKALGKSEGEVGFTHCSCNQMPPILVLEISSSEISLAARYN
ncbi:MAG: hypothetical protein Q7T74_01190 [Candidatus Saccharibacteria bacterium]|nr:hypothetical protein [Candidatus Saccharibacteria bacterium]